VTVDGPTAQVRIGGLNLQLPHRGASQGPVKLAARPDAILLDEAVQAGALAGTVRKTSYLGTQVEYDVESPIGNLFVVQHGRKEPIAPGTPVSISFTTQRGVAIIPEA
jgi:iron(III) transport system ATP-binding protein